MKLRSTLLLLLAVVVIPACADSAELIDLGKIDRSIAKEPAYRSEPHYALLVVGLQAAHRSWLVIDGEDLLYLDRNGNGDLTEAEDRIELDAEATKKIRVAEGSGYSGFNVFEIGTLAGQKLRLEFWVRKRDYSPTDDWEAKIMRQREQNHWEIATLLRLADGGLQVQNPLVLTTSRADAQITHLGGAVTLGLRGSTNWKLLPWPQSTTLDLRIGTPALPPRNHTGNLFAPLATSELPPDLHPRAVITYPPKLPGGQPIVQTLTIDNRCCGDSFFTHLSVPRDAGDGTAQVSLSYAAGQTRVVHPTTIEVPIGGQRSTFDRETSYVFFSDPTESIGLDEAMVALRVAGLTVQKLTRPESASLQVQEGGRIIFTITLSQKPEVLAVAKALAENGRFVEPLQQATSRFDIVRFPQRADFRQKELALIHQVLLKETGGVVHTPWDKKLARE